MGAWGFGPFENDDAGDWLYELEQSPDDAVIVDTLERVASIGDEYLEAPDCSNAIAAVEVVAALCGHPGNKFPDNAKHWVETHQEINPDPLVPTALAVLQRIRAKSELQELWDESAEADKWHATLDDLAGRLRV